MSILRLIIAVLPIILIGLYIYKKDKEKESSNLLFKLFMGGVLSCFPAVIIGLFLSFLFPPIDNMKFFQTFLYVFFVVATVEEVCKWFILYNISYNNNEFDSLYDMIVYSSFVALGFACFENILYVSDAGIKIGLLRAITAVPGHVCDGVLMGFHLSRAKICHLNNDYNDSKKYKMLSVIVPIISHGIYDFCLFWPTPVFIIIFILFIIFLFIYCFVKVRNISLYNIKFKYYVEKKYCVKCGNLVSNNYCTNCGEKNIKKEQDLT